MNLTHILRTYNSDKNDFSNYIVCNINGGAEIMANQVKK